MTNLVKYPDFIHATRKYGHPLGIEWILGRSILYFRHLPANFASRFSIFPLAAPNLQITLNS